LFVFFFQAEDGIRDFHGTGVQTCALPIFLLGLRDDRRGLPVGLVGALAIEAIGFDARLLGRGATLGQVLLDLLDGDLVLGADAGQVLLGLRRDRRGGVAGLLDDLVGLLVGGRARGLGVLVGAGARRDRVLVGLGAGRRCVLVGLGARGLGV